MPSRRRRVLAALTVAPLGLTGLAVLAPSASAASPDLVISEAYGGGGNSRATLRSDFVELANRGWRDALRRDPGLALGLSDAELAMFSAH